MRVPYDQVFAVNPDGSVSPKVAVRIGGIQMGPGVAFGRGVQFAGLDLAAIRGCDLEVESYGNLYEIKGYYQR
jgi:hypothetical protein